MDYELQIPEKLLPLLEPCRWKIVHGGRGGAKSETIGRLLLILAMQEASITLCAREYQASIGDSVHALLSALIVDMGLSSAFSVQEKTIECLTTGSTFIFKGLKIGIDGIKSMHGIKRVWVEEAEKVSKASFETLGPTIRAEKSEIWISFNPDDENSAAYSYVLAPPDDALVIQINWDENPFFPDVLEKERVSCLRRTPDDYDHIWGGQPRKISEAVIFGKRVIIDAFEPPEGTRFFYGADWGFANDPTALIRSYILDDCLYIDQEAFGYGVELDDLWKLFAGQDGATNEQLAMWSPADDNLYPGVPGARLWPIKADSARPETISYMRRQGFQIDAAAKWPGSVEDGITHLKGFKRIYIHDRCKKMQQEARLYSYKVDKKTGDILPIIVDAWNHGWDAVRYSLDGYIQSRGGMGIWARLGQP
jgi:phage terminase large subunit